jgi:hypothetical protein
VVVGEVEVKGLMDEPVDKGGWARLRCSFQV